MNDGARTPDSEPTSSHAQDSLDVENVRAANTVGRPWQRTKTKKLQQNPNNVSTVGQSISEVKFDVESESKATLNFYT